MIRQTNIFEAAMSTFSKTQDLAAQSLNSAGTAAKANADYLASDQAKINQFQTTVSSMWQNFISSDLIGNIAQVGTVLVQNILPALTAIVGIIVTIQAKNISSFISGIGSSIKNLVTNIKNFQLSEVDALGVVGSLGTAISLVIIGINAYNSAVQANIEQTKQEVETIENENSTILSLISQYEELGQKTNITSSDKTTLKSIQDQLIKTFGSEASGLDLVNGKYDDQIAKLEKLSIDKAKANQDTLQANLNNAKANASGNVFRDYQNIFSTGQATMDVRDITGANILGADAQTAYNEIEKAIGILKQEGQQGSSTFTDLATAATIYKGRLDDVTKAQQEFDQNQLQIKFAPQMAQMTKDAEDLKNAISSGNTSSASKASSDFQKLNTEIQNTKGLSPELKKAFSDWANGLGDISSANQKVTTTTNAAYLANQQLADSLTDLSKSNVANYQSLQTILDDVGKYKTLSSTDLNSLLKIFPDTANSILEYNAGLKSTSSMVELIKQKMQSLQNSYQQELQQALTNNSDFYSSTITKHTDLINQLKTNYGIDYANYSTYAQLKIAVDNAVLSAQVTNTGTTGQQLAAQYLSNVQNYSQYESAKTSITNQINDSIQSMNSAQIAKLATVYGIDVKDFSKIQNGKVVAAGEIADKIAQIYGAVNGDFTSNIKSQLSDLQTQANQIKQDIANPSEPWEKSADKSNLNRINAQIKEYQDLIAASSGDTTDLQAKIDKIISGVKVTIPSTTSGEKSGSKDAATQAKEEANAAKEAAKNAYDTELKKLKDNEDEGLYKSKLDYYNALIKLKVKYSKNSYIDQETKDTLDKTIQDTLKGYGEDVYSTSLKQLEDRESKGQVKSGSKEELENLQEIYKNLTTNPLMKSANTEDRRNEVEQKIYESKKGILDSEKTDLEYEKSIGQVQEGSLDYINRLQQIKSDIQKSDLNAVDKAEKLRDINEEIYSAQESYNEKQISSVEHLVNIGKIQENSLAYVNKLKSLYNSLNLTFEQRQSLQEKIFSAEKSYISQLESDLSDETIIGSYGYQMKQIENQIDALNDENDAYSKQIALEKAKAELEEAQQQKSVQIYESGKGFVYEADQSAITEKQQSLVDAQKAEQIEQLTQQKQALQNELDDQKSQLESALKYLEGYDTNSTTEWDKIQNQVNNVLDKINDKISSSTDSNVSDYSDQSDALDDLTNDTTDNYQQQIDSANKYLETMKTLTPQILAQNQTLVNSYQSVANALNNMASAFANAEENRENANYEYYEYNKELKSNGNKVKYASGTNSSVEGWANTDEEGYEFKLQPISSGKYTWLNEGSKVWTAQMTDNLAQLSKVNPQALLARSVISSNVSTTTPSSTSKSYSISMDGANINFPNATNTDQIKQAFFELPSYFLQKSNQ